MKIKTKHQSGLSILEVCLMLAALALVAGILLPQLSDKPRPRQSQCLANLKQAGLALLTWANDGDGSFPWASTNVGGTRSFEESPQVFRHFLAVSNELVTPKILLCPTDRKRSEAWDFSKFSNANLSYFISLDARDGYALGLLSGDRNLTGGTLSHGFLRLLNPASADAGWTTELHNNFGNVSLSDGSGQQVTPELLREELKSERLPVVRLAIP